MASSLQRLTSSVLASLPKFAFDLQFLRDQQPQQDTRVPSMLFNMDNNEQELTLQIPGLKQTETEEAVWVSFDVPKSGLFLPKIGFEGFNFFFQLRTSEKTYLAVMKLPEKFDRFADLKLTFENGVCSICLPTLKIPDPLFVQANISQLLVRPTPYCEMFNRAELGRRLCEAIGHPGVKSKSFTAYKKETDESIYFKGNMPGLEKVVVMTAEGWCVSLSMPGFKLEDVEVGFEYDTLIVEGKRGGEHYIAGVRVPEGFQRENDVIKKEMKDGVFKATVPHVDR